MHHTISSSLPKHKDQSYRSLVNAPGGREERNDKSQENTYEWQQSPVRREVKEDEAESTFTSVQHDSLS